MKLIRSIHPEVKIIDARQGLVDYIASDESLDCYREIIKAAGWKFDRFSKNAPFVDSHNYDSIECLLGKVINFSVQGKQLVERVQWAVDVEEQPLAKLGFKLTENGYLKAVSVGFFPEKFVSKWGDNNALAEAVQELGLDAATAAKVSCIFLEQQQIELSACIIGANPNALAKAHKDGAVSDGELAALGLGDEEMHFLRVVESDEIEAPNFRAFVARELRDVIKHFSAKTKANTASTAANRADADEARRRERDEFLRKFKQATQPQADS